MREVYLATTNIGKLREFCHAFEGSNIQFLSTKNLENLPEIEETADTYEGNALIKARAIASLTNQITIADDSGLEIDEMPGELGVYTARFGDYKPSSEVNEIILQRMAGKTNRTARYVCAIALVEPVSGLEKVVIATCEGQIHDRQEGRDGFGFDPIFYIAEYGKTMAQVPLDLKNKTSHRALAIEKLKLLL
ncbi:MAG TPA: RdgB/HAM1 family non-canonical purine NTP pyrophosphatase [Nitrospinota bacterium]|jgi:XTP/dITP diphosphohydrolase|nr:RdgB/HAM1 family non-canonical purine NTP pyrophosphatase [Nitrospinota bacterium]|tara:strand:- start:15400 stop:15975 length:576 start_codon:yes stop_codon:yes gene_type:complete